MAGIGFVLQKVLKEGGLISLVKVALAGTIIVAGPWILSIVGIFFIGRFAQFAIAEAANLFMGVIIYCYAFSLVIFGGFHYIFTRQVADLIYEEKNREAGAALLQFSLWIILFAVIISVIAFLNLDLRSISQPILFRAAGVFLFVIINLIWILMIFISLLKKYLLIFFVYMVGMAVSLAGVILLGRLYAAGGALLGFALGQFFIVLFLYIMAFAEFKPAKLDFKGLLSYFKKFKLLLLSGIFYYWGMWIDKIVFWFLKGSPVNNTYIKVFDIYDIPVYLANLTLIPGLIYFIIISETNFYNSLIDFLKSLHTATYQKIQERKYRMLAVFRKGMREQTVFQGIFTIITILLASAISSSLFSNSIDLTVFRITLLAGFFHLTFLTLVIYLFYLQLFGTTALASFIYFFINLIGSIIISFLEIPGFYGLSFLAAAAVGSLFCYIALIPAIRRFDRILYIQSSKG